MAPVFRLHNNSKSRNFTHVYAKNKIGQISFGLRKDLSKSYFKKALKQILFVVFILGKKKRHLVQLNKSFILSVIGNVDKKTRVLVRLDFFKTSLTYGKTLSCKFYTIRMRECNSFKNLLITDSCSTNYLPDIYTLM